MKRLFARPGTARTLAAALAAAVVVPGMAVFPPAASAQGQGPQGASDAGPSTDARAPRPARLPERLPAGSADPDAGTRSDAGTRADAQALTDAGALADAGTRTDAGAVEDAGATPNDAGAAEQDGGAAGQDGGPGDGGAGAADAEVSGGDLLGDEYETEPEPPRSRRPSLPAASAAVPPPVPTLALPPPFPPAASAEPQEEAPIRFMDRTVFVVRGPRGGRTPEQRARAAVQVLERAAQEPEIPEVRVDISGDVAVIYVGQSPLIQLGPSDALAAGDASLGVHADTVASKVRDTLARERSRSQAAQLVFSVSLVVFSGLIALALLRKVGELVKRVRGWIADHPDKLPAIVLGGIEIVRPAAFKGALSVSLGVLRVLAQIGVIYTWLIFSFSLFEATASVRERLTGFVLAPVSALVGRLAVSVPVLVIAIFAALVVLLVLRFVGLFFGSVAREETKVGWLPADLAAPTGVLVRMAIVVGALVFGAPLVTGVSEGSLARTGMVMLVMLGLAAVPVLASAATGVAVVYGRKMRLGDMVEVGGRAGRVRELSLLEVRLEDEDGCPVRVPHLLSLVHPTRLLGRHPLMVIALSVSPSADLARTQEILARAAGSVSGRARVNLVGLDEGGAHFRVTLVSEDRDARGRWLAGAALALAAAGISLGRPPEGKRSGRSAAPGEVP
ncbi:mechanosensitive ion channel domain-containing protein [Chondromyces apiculatus]|uniref:Mechanosensitive ion channel MscS domain-containing protein n=1 Tax=Chondromyces apiculatus DSM 436 TaxID=1192034 RepID=A0A017TFN8_9BACT|nr:mechanosensitive ion channel family protein [Chondromyces apiculatus]EYF07747.1 Hypothetical protein CAP_8248 [Chondromyces apiculatus DSM 436]